jgi:hypothetical protein
MMRLGHSSPNTLRTNQSKIQSDRLSVTTEYCSQTKEENGVDCLPPGALKTVGEKNMSSELGAS